MISEPIIWNGQTVPQCRVCGGSAGYRGPGGDGGYDPNNPGVWRCYRHTKSNPCAVEGCKRSRASKDGWLHDGRYWLCRDHWRLACPPKSKWRRAYLRFWKIAKRMGCEGDNDWPDELERRFWRYFGGLVARARRMAAGDLDMTEINKLFGWDNA